MALKLSVIVPVLNREKLVVRSLESILNQTEKPDEIIIVDNGSTDGTYETVSDWINNNSNTGITLKLLKEETPGAWAARYKGQNESMGDYLIFFDSDDTMRPTLIENVRKKIEENPDIDLVCWRCKIHQLDGSTRIPPFMADNPLEGHLIHTLLRPQGYAISYDFVRKTGGWNKPLKVWDDLELGLRIIQIEPTISPINDVLADIYSQEESITGKDFSSKEGEWEKVLDEMVKDSLMVPDPLHTRINKIINYRRAILAANYAREGNKKGASRLMGDTLEGKTLSEKLLLKFTYHYTRIGLRGAWRLVRPAYRFQK